MEIDLKTQYLRFDVELLAGRLSAATEWLVQGHKNKDLRIGCFGSSTGAAATLIAAAKPNNNAVKVIVSRGGRPDLAASKGVLQHVTAPMLLIVGGTDTAVVGMNKSALKQLVRAEAKELVIIPGATHLFEESGKMEEVAKIAAEWFECYLLKNGKKFENKFSQKASGLFSLFKEKPHIHIRFKDRAAAGDMLASKTVKL
jgi:putative phosphoribosyl transferase